MNTTTNKNNGSAKERVEARNLQDYYKIVASNKWYIIVIAVVVIAIGTYNAITSPSIYESKAKLMIENQSDMGDIFSFQGNFTNETMANEIQILKSRELKARLIISLWDSPLKDSLFILGTRQIDTTESYVSKIKTSAKNVIKTIIKGVVGNGNGHSPTKDPTQNQYSQLNEWVSNRVQELPEGLTLDKLYSLVKGLGPNSFKIQPNEESTIINISHKSLGKEEAQLVLEKFITIYQKTDEERSAKEITKLNSFLNEKVHEREKELQKARKRMENFQEKELVFGVEGKNQSILEQTTQIESKYFNAQAEVEIKQQELKLLRSQLSERESRMAEKVGNVIDSELRALRQQLVQLQAKKVGAINKYNQEHPEVANIQDDIDKIKNKINTKTNQLIKQGISVADPITFSQELVAKILKSEAELEAQKAKVEQYNKIVERYNNKLQELPEKQLQYAYLKRELAVLEENYIFLRKKQQETRINRAFEAGKIRIIDHAFIAEKVEPNVRQIILNSILIGIVLGVGFAFVKDYLNNTLTYIEDLEDKNIPVLSRVPHTKNTIKEINSENSKINNEVVTYFKPLHPISESYRNLRTNINLSTADKQIKSILITSPGSTEGKTTIVSNLAVTYANMGKKTLIVDCDLRRSRVHREFGLHRKTGLIQHLVDDQPLDEVIKPTEQENLSVITSGGHPPNPSELLDSDKMRNLMDKLARDFDNIIYDSPPVIPVSDSIILSDNVDFLVLAAMLDNTHKDALDLAVEKLEQVKSNPNGFVINGVREKHHKYGKYNYYYKRYYRYYQEDGKSRKHRHKRNIFQKIFS